MPALESLLTNIEPILAIHDGTYTFSNAAMQDALYNEAFFEANIQLLRDGTFTKAADFTGFMQLLWDLKNLEQLLAIQEGLDQMKDEDSEMLTKNEIAEIKKKLAVDYCNGLLFHGNRYKQTIDALV